MRTPTPPPLPGTRALKRPLGPDAPLVRVAGTYRAGAGATLQAASATTLPSAPGPSCPSRRAALPPGARGQRRQTPPHSGKGPGGRTTLRFWCRPCPPAPTTRPQPSWGFSGLLQGPPLRFCFRPRPPTPTTCLQPSREKSPAAPLLSVRPSAWPALVSPSSPDPLFPFGTLGSSAATLGYGESPPRPQGPQTSLLTLFQSLEEATEPGPGPQGRARSSPGPDRSQGWLLVPGVEPWVSHSSPAPTRPPQAAWPRAGSAAPHHSVRQAKVTSSCELLKTQSI